MSKATLVLLAVDDVKKAVPCVASYALFDPDDEVMKSNLVYYHFHKDKLGLTEDDFLPRSVSVFCPHLFYLKWSQWWLIKRFPISLPVKSCIYKPYLVQIHPPPRRHFNLLVCV